MTTPILLVAIGRKWFATARIPRPLANAGFDVSLLTPADSLAEHSAYVGRLELLPDEFTPEEWVVAFAKMVREQRPRIVVPCDDQAWLLLQLVAEHAPPGMHVDEYRELTTLLRRSLGEAAHFRTSTSKTLLPAAAQSLGVRMPAWAIVSNAREVESFAAGHGFPVVLKLAYGFGGDAVVVCEDRSAIGPGIAALRQSFFADVGSSSEALLAQAYVAGGVAYYFISAWEGKLLAGYATDRLAGREPRGYASVIRYRRDPAMRAIAERVVDGFAMSGLAGLECIVDERTGEPWLIEINRRVTPGMERGSILGVDVCAALHAAVTGQPSPTRADLDEGETGIRCSFPQEWIRDPRSEWLRKYPVDIPWDEPALIEAMLAMRR